MGADSGSLAKLTFRVFSFRGFDECDSSSSAGSSNLLVAFVVLRVFLNVVEEGEGGSSEVVDKEIAVEEEFFLDAFFRTNPSIEAC